MHENLEYIGGITYNESEKEFATKIILSYDSTLDITSASSVLPYNENVLVTFSSDVGDVSWNVPTAGLRTAAWVNGTVAHSWQAVTAGRNHHRSQRYDVSC